MCSYCGCQALPVIKLLTRQHEEIINKLGQVRRAAEKSNLDAAQNYTRELVDLLDPHTDLEEEGVFIALLVDDEFIEPVAKLTLDHTEITELISVLLKGDLSVVRELDTRLRDHISNEENGLFPAAAVSFDGAVWDQIERDYINIPMREGLTL